MLLDGSAVAAGIVVPSIVNTMTQISENCFAVPEYPSLSKSAQCHRRRKKETKKSSNKNGPYLEKAYFSNGIDLKQTPLIICRPPNSSIHRGT